MTVTDATGADHVIPSFLQLNSDVTKMVDELTGAVAEAQAINSQTLAFSNAAHDSAVASEVSAGVSAARAQDSDNSAAESRGFADASSASANASANSATAASASKVAAKGSEDAASASKVAAKASEDAARANMDNAGFSAAAAKTYRDDAAAARDMSSSYANAPVNVEVSPGKYSAYHWAEQARLVAVGAVIYRGSWDASGGTMPASPKLGDFYLISKAGTVGSVSYKPGDMAVFDGTLWERIDNQQAVTSVAGRTGAVTLTIGDIAALQAALDAKQAAIDTKQAKDAINISFKSPDGLTTASIGWGQDISINGGPWYKLWHAGNFDPASKANVAAPTFTGTATAASFVATSGSARVQNWGGTATDAVLYMGNANSYIYKAGGNFNFNNEQGGFNAVLSSGGTIWTSNAITPLDRNSGGNLGGGLWMQAQSAEKQYGWAFNDRSVYLYSNPTSKDIGLYDTVNGSRWRTDTGGNFFTGQNLTVGGGFIGTSQTHAVLGNNGSAGIVYLRPNGTGNSAGETRVHSNGDMYVGSWVYANNFKLNSDRRLKRKAVLLNARNELDRIKRLIPRRYIKSGKVEYGFFAQEFDGAYPTMVTVGDGPAGPDTHTISQMELIAPIVAVLQDLDRRLTEAGL